MIVKKETQIKTVGGLPILIDVYFDQSNNTKKPLVIFCHGFKGFKDWGAWNLVAEAFAKKSFAFVKFNFSHNGTSPEKPLDFDNLKAFSENNYSKELSDLEQIIDWVSSSDFLLNKVSVDRNKINLIGHSRGGGAVFVKALEEPKVTNLATWAAIDSYNRFGTAMQIQKWEQDGEHIFINGRTGQKMPIKYQFYEDFIQNRNRLNIKKAVSQLEKPLLVVHGTADPAVQFESAQNIAAWAKNAELLAIENANHVFGASHPYSSKRLPIDLQTVVDKTISFFNMNN